MRTIILKTEKGLEFDVEVKTIKEDYLLNLVRTTIEVIVTCQEGSKEFDVVHEDRGNFGFIPMYDRKEIDEEDVDLIFEESDFSEIKEWVDFFTIEKINENLSTKFDGTFNLTFEKAQPKLEVAFPESGLKKVANGEYEIQSLIYAITKD